MILGHICPVALIARVVRNEFSDTANCVYICIQINAYSLSVVFIERAYYNEAIGTIPLIIFLYNYFRAHR